MSNRIILNVSDKIFDSREDILKVSEENKSYCPVKEAIPFLDTSCQLIDGKLIFDLYRKETDRVQYLLPSSCHEKNIPFSPAMRSNRYVQPPRNHHILKILF